MDQDQHQQLGSQSDTIIGNVVDGVIMIDEQGTILIFSQSAEQMFGYSIDEVIGRNISMLMPSHDSAAYNNYLKSYTSTGVKKIIGTRRETVARRRDGSEFPIHLYVNEAKFRNDNTSLFVGLIHDISQQKRLEESFKLHRGRLQSFDKTYSYMRFPELNPGITIQFNKIGKIELYNKAALALSSKKDILGCLVQDIIPALAGFNFIDHIMNSSTKDMEVDVAGSYFQISLIGDSNTQAINLYGTDITAQKQIQSVLQRKNEELEEAHLSAKQARDKTELILNSAGNGIYGLDLELNITFINTTGARMLGWEQEALVGKSLHDILNRSKINGLTHQEATSPMLRAIKAGKIYRRQSWVYYKEDGTSFPMEYHCTPIKESGKHTGTVVAFRDISERKRIKDKGSTYGCRRGWAG